MQTSLVKTKLKVKFSDKDTTKQLGLINNIIVFALCLLVLLFAYGYNFMFAQQVYLLLLCVIVIAMLYNVCLISIAVHVTALVCNDLL